MKKITFTFVFLCMYMCVYAQGQLLDQEGLNNAMEYRSLEEALKEPLKVYKLDISNQSLKKLPKEIGKLKNLQIFDCRNTQLTTLPKEIGELKNLQELTCYNNKLTSLPKEIGALKNLQEFYGQNNQLTSLPKEIGELKKLQKFYFSGNKFSEVEKTKIKALLPSECDMKF